MHRKLAMILLGLLAGTRGAQGSKNTQQHLGRRLACKGNREDFFRLVDDSQQLEIALNQ